VKCICSHISESGCLLEVIKVLLCPVTYGWGRSHCITVCVRSHVSDSVRFRRNMVCVHLHVSDLRHLLGVCVCICSYVSDSGRLIEVHVILYEYFTLFWFGTFIRGNTVYIHDSSFHNSYLFLRWRDKPFNVTWSHAFSKYLQLRT